MKILNYLYQKYADDDIEVIWYDQKGFRMLDCQKKRWQVIGKYSNARTKESRVVNYTLQLAMTKNRIVGYQWIKGGVTHVEVLSFW